jgi:hypothetical protein
MSFRGPSSGGGGGNNDDDDDDDDEDDEDDDDEAGAPPRGLRTAVAGFRRRGATPHRDAPPPSVASCVARTCRRSTLRSRR